MRQKYFFSFLFWTALSGSLLFPLISAASGIYQTNRGPACYEGIVPCGLGKPLRLNGTLSGQACTGGTPITTQIGTKTYDGTHCQLCHFFVMFKGILDFILKLVFVIAILMFVAAGFMFLIGGGDPSRLSAAKQIITSTMWGLVIIFAAWILVNTIFIFIGVAGWTGLTTNWFKINCPINLPL